jgi:hypothetical protein
MTRRTRGEGTVTFKKKLKLWAAKVPTDQVDTKGKRRYVYAYGKTKEEAARKRTLLQRQVEERTLPEPHRMTVEDLMTTYIENKVGRIKTRTIDLYSFDAKRHINPKIGQVLISKLMPLHIERMQADRLGHRDPAFTLRTYAHVFDHHRHGGAFSLDTLLAEPDRTVKG